MKLSNRKHPHNRIWRSWECLKRRCDKPSDVAYSHYGGRGISYCKKWITFDGFIDDMGYPNIQSPSIDRIDPNGDYTKTNCRWIERKFQAFNRVGKRTKELPKGVCFRKDSGCYRSRIRVNGCLLNIGQFSSIKEASDAYDIKAKEYFGEYAYLNEWQSKS